MTWFIKNKYSEKNNYSDITVKTWKEFRNLPKEEQRIRLKSCKHNISKSLLLGTVINHDVDFEGVNNYDFKPVYEINVYSCGRCLKTFMDITIGLVNKELKK